MLNSCNSLQVEEKGTLFNKSSNKKQDTQEIINPKNNSEVLNENDYDDITNIIIQPNHDIPKTIYYKRLCEKLIKQNETNSCKNKTLKCIENSNTEIIQDKHEFINNNMLKETGSHVSHNDSLHHLNSTLVICESDVTLSECELDTTPINNFENLKKSKNNITFKSFSPELKQPKNLNKNMVLNSTTKKIQNLSNDTFKCVEKLKENENLELKIINKISVSPETKIIKYQNKDDQSTVIKEHDIKYSLIENDEIPLETNEIHNKNVFTPNKINQIPSINIEVEQIPCKKKKVVTEKNNATVKVAKVIESSRLSCLSSSEVNNCNMSTKHVKNLSDNEKELSSIPKQGNNQLELPVDHCVDGFKKFAQLKDTVINSSTSTAVETSLANKINIPFINIEVDQVPMRRKRVVVLKDNDFEENINKLLHVTSSNPSTDSEHNVLTKNAKHPPINKKKELSSPITQNINYFDGKIPDNNNINSYKKCTQSNNTVIGSPKNTAPETSLADKIGTPSINIKVEQVPIRRKRVIIPKDNNFEITEVRKSFHMPCSNLSSDDEFNTSSKNVKCLFMNHKEKTSSSLTKNNQLKHKLPVDKHVGDLNKFTRSNDPNKNSTENTVIDPCVINSTDVPSISIEVEQGSMFRHSSTRKVIMRSSSLDNKQEIKKGRRVELITIKNHYSQPLPSFNGAKMTEIDVSKNKVHIEKVVESSSRFYVPQVKRRRPMNFGNADF